MITNQKVVKIPEHVSVDDLRSAGILSDTVMRKGRKTFDVRIDIPSEELPKSVQSIIKRDERMGSEASVSSIEKIRAQKSYIVNVDERSIHSFRYLIFYPGRSYSIGYPDLDQIISRELLIKTIRLFKK